MARIETIKPTEWVPFGLLVGWEKVKGVRCAVISVPGDFEGPEHAKQEAERWLKEQRAKRVRRYKEDPMRNIIDLDSVDGT